MVSIVIMYAQNGSIGNAQKGINQYQPLYSSNVPQFAMPSAHNSNLHQTSQPQVEEIWMEVYSIYSAIAILNISI